MVRNQWSVVRIQGPGMNEFEELVERKPVVCSQLMKKVREYYADESHEAAFRQWYKETYGHEYEPEKRSAI